MLVFGLISKFFRGLLRSSPAPQMRTGIIRIESDEEAQPFHVARRGTIRLDDGTTIEVPDYDHAAIRNAYFARAREVGEWDANLARIGLGLDPSEDDIQGWLTVDQNVGEEGQVVDPDHLPYNPKLGF